MNSNDESFLNSLLQYHTRLVDQEFVDNIINKIKERNKSRVKLMAVAMLLACTLAVPLLGSATSGFAFFTAFMSLSPYLITFLLFCVLGFCAWLTSESF